MRRGPVNFGMCSSPPASGPASAAAGLGRSPVFFEDPEHETTDPESETTRAKRKAKLGKRMCPEI